MESSRHSRGNAQAKARRQRCAGVQVASSRVSETHAGSQAGKDHWELLHMLEPW